MYFWYRRSLKGSWPVRSLDKPNSLRSEQYTKDVEDDSNVRDQVVGTVIELSGEEENWPLDSLVLKYPYEGSSPKKDEVTALK